MAEYEVKIVDAFTTERYAGNPCGVITRAEGLTDAQMQAIAREINASETAFVFPSRRADFRVHFFTPTSEIPLAGHPTIATMHTLAEEGRIDLSAGRARVTQELSIGVLPVDIVRQEGGHVRVIMTQARPEFGRRLDRNVFAEALGISVSDMLPDVPVQVVSTGTPQAMVPVRSLEVLRRLKPNVQHLSDLEAVGHYFSVHVFTLEAFDPAHRAHARHFAARAGIPEDPVTGSATGAMAAYLWKYGLLRERAYRVEQGHIMGRPGLVDVEVDAEGDEPVGIRIAGTAVTVLRGTLAV
ncbi:PhzF family phenazine biosynthesis isomerase [Tepidiforma sp.]|uniref:PhzF family phenazine biosynthesis protein n=1 Tax=Tepidiforma sp. TaxID=2682230 RepID=UPI002ADE72F3|nr:PhzF family phenazine biosynthesis isomerase [Tepidiforma sp.]